MSHEEEPLLKENPHRFTLFPIKHVDLWEQYKRQVQSMWIAEEIDLSGDIHDWNTLSDGERHFIKHVLAFFAGSDGIVLENLGARFINEVQYPEARCFYGFQMAMENIHSEVYSLLIDTYVTDTKEKQTLFDAIETLPIVEKKAKWAVQWIKSSSNFAERLIAFAVVEGIFFSGSFCSIFWMKKRGKLPGLCYSNEFISRDENMHCEFAYTLYNKHLVNKLPQEKVYAIVDQAVQIEAEFVSESIPVELIGMNSKLMIQYVKFVADRLLMNVGCVKLYHVTNPFDFMEMLSMPDKSNFFEKRVSAYRKANVNTSQETFSTTEEF